MNKYGSNITIIRACVCNSTETGANSHAHIHAYARTFVCLQRTFMPHMPLSKYELVCVCCFCFAFSCYFVWWHFSPRYLFLAFLLQCHKHTCRLHIHSCACVCVFMPITARFLSSCFDKILTWICTSVELLSCSAIALILCRSTKSILICKTSQ